MIKFEQGKKLEVRSIGDSDVKFKFEILKRTPKRITLKQEGDHTVTVGIIELDGEEIAYPFGKYSMAPVVRATKQN